MLVPAVNVPESAVSVWAPSALDWYVVVTPLLVTDVDCPASSVFSEEELELLETPAGEVFTALSEPELLRPDVDATTTVAMLDALVVAVGAGGSAQLNLRIGTNRVEHHGVHTGGQVDVSSRDQVEVLEVHGLNHVAADAADAVGRIRRDQLIIQDAGQGSGAASTPDVADDLRIRVGPAEYQIEDAAIDAGTDQIADPDQLDHGVSASRSGVGELSVVI